jgi:hypothetical protein
MESRSKLLDGFTSAFDDIDRARALELLDLSDHELSELGAGVAALPDPIRAACQAVLGDWQNLDARARVATLLMLANALASQE